MTFSSPKSLVDDMPTCNFRHATLADCKQITACIDAAYSRYRDQIIDLPDVSAGISGDIENNVVIVAETDSKIIGGYILVVAKDHALLANIFVDPVSSGTGIGRQLLSHCETWCRDKSLREIRLSTHVDMPDNVALYERHGWTVTERTGTKIKMAKVI